MRRLPVYLLLDTSGSMHGEPIEAVKNGVQTLLTTLKQDHMHWKLHMSLSLLSTLLLVRPYLLQISSVSISPLFRQAELPLWAKPYP